MITALVVGLTLQAKPNIVVSYYGTHFNAGRHTMANGRTYSRTRKSCATWLYPLGTKIEISANGEKVVCVVEDRTHRKYKNRIDLPDGVWASFKYPMSKGIFKASVRRVK